MLVDDISDRVLSHGLGVRCIYLIGHSLTASLRGFVWVLTDERERWCNTDLFINTVLHHLSLSSFGF